VPLRHDACGVNRSERRRATRVPPGKPNRFGQLGSNDRDTAVVMRETLGHVVTGAPQRSGDVLGAVLAAVSRNTGAAAVLGPVWRQAVGETIAAVSAPTRWLGTTLVIGCTSARWAKELEASRDELTRRLVARVGPKAVARLLFEAP